MKKQKTLWLTIGVAVVVAGLAFYGGWFLGKNQRPKNNFGGAQLGGQNLNRRQIQVGSMVNGTILSKDDKSITVKSRDGGSKIVFFSPSTKVLKSVDGSVDDLQVDSNVTASGQTNADGSVSAQMIQLRQDANFFNVSGTPAGPGDQAPMGGFGPGGNRQ